jgi:hypothetical protein
MKTIPVETVTQKIAETKKQQEQLVQHRAALLSELQRTEQAMFKSEGALEGYAALLPAHPGNVPAPEKTKKR